MEALTKTNYNFPNQTNVYHGKVRDVYTIGKDTLVMIATDRISAFDIVLPKGIPYKGQVLNQIASQFLDATSDIVCHLCIFFIFLIYLYYLLVPFLIFRIIFYFVMLFLLSA